MKKVNILVGLIVIALVILVGAMILLELQSSIKPTTESFPVSNPSLNQTFHTQEIIYSLDSVRAYSVIYGWYDIDVSKVTSHDNKINISSDLLMSDTIIIQITYNRIFTLMS